MFEATTTPPVPVWQARVQTPPAADLLRLSGSVEADALLVMDDLAGSIAHVAALHAAGLLVASDALALIEALQALARAHANGEWRLDPALEDVHMNIEQAIEGELGAVAGRLHTGRSRNDQVATALTLQARRLLAELASTLEGTSVALAAAAAPHLETPWTARTHGRPAQPATLGFLLAAHAWRFHQAADATLRALASIDTSPLGAGAVAGSTLPLRPDVAAALLGLKPLENALLASGTRMQVSTAVHAAVACAPALAGLAVDLLALQQEGGYAPPSTYTTGSSLMPQKQNPDGLELVRAKARGLIAHLVAVDAVTTGLGLGYHRDFQETKPAMAKALEEAALTARVLAAHVEPACFTAAPPADVASGIGCTDAAEALVLAGVPFRTAYRLVAGAAAQQADLGVPLAEAIRQAVDAQGLGAGTAQVVVDALVPDATRRATRGGAAPEAVGGSLARLAATHAAFALQLQAAHAAVSVPKRLIASQPTHVLEAARARGLEVTP